MKQCRCVFNKYQCQEQTSRKSGVCKDCPQPGKPIGKEHKGRRLK